jgi:Glycosyl-transferase for dystroglycan
MENATMPANKSDLTRMFYDNEVIFFHFKICKTCHLVPKAYEWINATEKEGEIAKYEKLDLN